MMHRNLTRMMLRKKHMAGPRMRRGMRWFFYRYYRGLPVIYRISKWRRARMKPFDIPSSFIGYLKTKYGSPHGNTESAFPISCG